MTNNNVTFDEYKVKSRSILGQSESPAMIRSLVKMGLVKNEQQAFNLMVTLIFLFIAATAYITYINFFKSEVVPPLTPEEEMFFNRTNNLIQQ